MAEVVSNFPQFQAELRDYIARLPVEVVVPFQKKMTLLGFAGVVKKSPVLTGRFRGNWQVGIGQSASVPELSTLDAGTQGSSPSVFRELAALQELSSLQPYDATYVANALPYAERLESGYSKQAPGGMVSLTIGELQQVLVQEDEL